MRSRVLLAVALACFASPAAAAPCGRPDIDLTQPPEDATSVPTNAHLSAHYSAPALYDDEPVTLLDAQGQEVTLAVSFDGADSMLRAIPDQPLAPGFHELVWPGLRGVSGTGVGRSRTVGFFVHAEPDSAPPTFQGLQGVAWDLSRDRDPCLDRLEDRFVFQLDVGDAGDDSGQELLQVLVFQTREPGGGGQREPARVALRALPPGDTLEVRRPADRAGETCFAAVVQDSVGNVSGGGEREVCLHTKKPPLFDGCSVASPASPASRTWTLPLVGLLAGGLLWRRRGTGAPERTPA